MKRRLWRNIGYEIEIDTSNIKQIFITNPKEVIKRTIDDVWEKLVMTLGSYEFEYWLAEEIVMTCNDAVIKGEDFADISEISGATLYLGEDDSELQVSMSNKFFKKVLISLPIFKIMKTTDEETLLEFVF